MWKLRGITVVDLQNHFIIVVGKAVDRSRQVLFGSVSETGVTTYLLPDLYWVLLDSEKKMLHGSAISMAITRIPLMPDFL